MKVSQNKFFEISKISEKNILMSLKIDFEFSRSEKFTKDFQLKIFLQGFLLKNFASRKRFSDFAQNWLRWGSDDIIFFKFGTFWIPIFPMGKKSNLLWKICIFFSKSLRASGTFFLNQNPYGHLALFFWGRVKKKVALIELKIGTYIVQIGWQNQYLHISEKIFLWV